MVFSLKKEEHPKWERTLNLYRSVELIGYPVLLGEQTDQRCHRAQSTKSRDDHVYDEIRTELYILKQMA